MLRQTLLGAEVPRSCDFLEHPLVQALLQAMPNPMVVLGQCRNLTLSIWPGTRIVQRHAHAASSLLAFIFYSSFEIWKIAPGLNSFCMLRQCFSQACARYIKFRSKWLTLATYRHRSWGRSCDTGWLSTRPPCRGGQWAIGCLFCSHLMHKLAEDKEKRKLLPLSLEICVLCSPLPYYYVFPFWYPSLQQTAILK